MRTHRPAFLRLGALAAAGVLAFGAVACGDDDDDPEISAEYVTAFDGYCTAIATSLTTAQSQIQALGRGGNAQQALQGLEQAFRGAVTGLRGAEEALKDADVPGDLEDFNDDVVEFTGKLAAIYEKGAEQAADGDLSKLRGLQSDIQALDAPDEPPKKLLERAKSCDQINRAADRN